MNPINGKTILLGVTGSIAAYKAADLASKLAQSGALVHVILTESAIKFISTLTFQSVTGQRAYTDADLWGSEAHVLHVGLAHKADLFVIAPASATTLAKLASGLADNLLSLTALAYHSEEKQNPLLLAPAMDAGMFSHPATQENLVILARRGAILIGPEEGHLASGLVAKGRMTEPPTILGQIRYQFSRSGPLAGKKVVVTAGGTQEEIDPVRYITNRSSGKQGYALAQAAHDAGAEVTLISTPTGLFPPIGAEIVATRNAMDMSMAVSLACKDADALLMAAAVADFRPAQPQRQKIKKESSIPVLELERTDDILSIIKMQREKTGFPRFVLGFAAETQDLLANAQVKLAAKGLDLIAVNDVSAADAGFEVETNRIILLWANGEKEILPLMSKFEVSERIVEKISTKLSSAI